jgi:ATP-dependent exoDNAse (exonuclease V) beta subunit
MVYNYVDSINLLYVAFTRPKEQLHIFFPAPMREEKEDKDTTVGHLIYKALGMKPKCNENGEVDTTSDIVYQYGTFDSVINPTEAEQGTVEGDDCTMSPFKMSLKLSSSRFIEARKGGAISPRQEGIVLHGIMERATTREDIERAIKQLSNNMVIDQAEAAQLLEQIDAMFSNPMVEEWFSDIWDEVYTESAIITKGAKTKRPDRVMVAADRVVVVDYKFGEQNVGNRVQVAQYAKLLQSMGYSNIEGYVWYVREGVIDKVL